jgi:Flp pilus assembly protein TadD
MAAEDALVQAQSAAQESGERPLEWRTWLALGRILRGRGRAVEARSAFNQAWHIAGHLAASIGDERIRATFVDQVGHLMPVNR